MKSSSKFSPILWQGSQRAVTAYGIEARDGSYTISKDRLSDPYWLSLADFAEALQIANGKFRFRRRPDRQPRRSAAR